METNRTRVTLSGVQKKCVAYGGTMNELVGYHEEGDSQEVPVGSIFRLTATVLLDIVTAEGKRLLDTRHLIVEAGPREFLRGRVVEGEEAQQLLCPPEIRQLKAMFGDMMKATLMDAENLRVVAITQSDGTETAVRLQDDDVPPPVDASPYAVGESPEELAQAAASEARTRRGNFDILLRRRTGTATGRGFGIVEVTEDGKDVGGEG